MSHNNIINNIKSKELNILVLGDFMLDHYLYGNVNRLSPEAPIPVVNYNKESFNLGGAGNVLHNLHNLGVNVYSLGIIGKDEPGNIIVRLIEDIGANKNNLIIESKINNTIQKTRIIGNKQQIVRIDKDTNMINDEDTLKIMDKIRSIINEVSAVIVSDYAKGICNKKIMKEVIILSKKNGIPVFIDPKGKNFSKYKSATCITPNLDEAKKVITKVSDDKESYFSAANSIRNDFSIDSCIITIGEHGLVYVDEKEEIYVDAIKKEVYDVSGAGDTVISAFTAALVSGVAVYDALCFANFAASTVVSHQGTCPLNINDLK